MKLEKLKNNHKQKIIIGGVIVLGIASAFILTTSKAKYKVTDTVQLGEGVVNYKVPDFKTIAMYIVEESAETETTTMPSANEYAIIEDKSYCNLNGTNTKDTGVVLKTTNGNHTIANIKKWDKCYLYFEKNSEMKSNDRVTQLVGSLHISTARSETITKDTEMDNGKLYSVPDGMYGGTSYVYAGTDPNNWVSFAGFYWRIIRINGDGSIRLIYNGTSATATGEGTQIGKKAYNSTYNDNAYVGFMYGATGQSTYGATHANSYNSTILGASDGSESGSLNYWYKNNIANKETTVTSKIDINGMFCNDRKVDKTAHNSWYGDGYGTSKTGYAPWGRLYSGGAWKTSQTPSLSCSQANDIFSANGASKGNKKLTYPVALITSDEVVLAGGFGGTARTFWLNTGQNYWTMSPKDADANGGSSSAWVFYVYSNGNLSSSNFVNLTYGVRPVINLRSDIKLTGNGTTSSPYEVV